MQALTLSLALPIRPAARHMAPHAPHQRRFAALPRATEKADAELEIEGLSNAYCDEFVCTSSPAVEASVRQLARDLQRANGKWAPIYTKDAHYSDTFRKFKGPAAFQRNDFVSSRVGQPAVTITAMRMLGNSSAQVCWRLTGSLGFLPIDVAVTTEIAMNLLTGRIENLTEKWDLKRCSPPAALAWTAARALWAAQQGSRDAGEAAGNVLDQFSMDEDEGSIQQPDANDPMKFFQQKDSTKQDAVFFCAVLLLFYTLVQAWFTIFAPASGPSNF